MLIKTRGIVFRSVKYRDTSLILDIYTRDLGLRTYIINGVRKAKARTSAAILQVMSQVELVAYENATKDINRIKEVKAAYLYRSLFYDIHKSSVGLFILEIARKSIREKEVNKPVYDFIESSFQFLDQSKEKVNYFHLTFLLYFSEMLGFNPENNYNDDTPYFDMREGSFSHSAPFHRDYMRKEETEALKILMQTPMEEAHRLNFNKETRNRLLDDLVSYYRIHLGDPGPFHSLEIFRDLFK